MYIRLQSGRSKHNSFDAYLRKMFISSGQFIRYRAEIRSNQKKALALAWTCECFQNFLIGKKFETFTDYKSLVPFLSDKDLNTIPTCIQRFRMRLMKFWYLISHIPGKENFSVDILSRSPFHDICDKFQNKAHMISIVISLPTIPACLDQIHLEQNSCDECRLFSMYLCTYMMASLISRKTFR